MKKGIKRFKIFDDIYGHIYFNDAEKNIINSPLFQRLRRIKQLGLAYLVFPGAIHTRFSHSIGTVAVAQKIADTLGLSEGDTVKLRMAALLHDIGHFPLSHTIESVYKKAREKARIEKLGLGTTDRSKKKITIKQKDITKKSNLGLHEEMGAKVITETDFNDGITKILRKEDYNPIEIANIITGKHENIMLSQLMHSDIDIDQMDYLIRDSKNAGIRYGTCDVDYLISCMVVEKPVIFFELKALKAIEHFFLARYFYFTQILYHRTRSVLEKLAFLIYENAMNSDFEMSGHVIHKVEDLDNLYRSRKLIHFDDSYFDNLLKTLISKGKNKRIKQYAKAVFERKPPKTVRESFRMIEKGDKHSLPRFMLKHKIDEIPIVESFEVLDNYDEIKKSESWYDEIHLLFGHREAVRLEKPSTYSPNHPKQIFLCEFPDTILAQIANYRFVFYRKYRVRS